MFCGLPLLRLYRCDFDFVKHFPCRKHVEPECKFGHNSKSCGECWDSEGLPIYQDRDRPPFVRRYLRQRKLVVAGGLVQLTPLE